MNVMQKLSILVFLKHGKADLEGNTPIYIKITIDGLERELSLGCKVPAAQWDDDNKMALAGAAALTYNKGQLLPLIFMKAEVISQYNQP